MDVKKIDSRDDSFNSRTKKAVEVKNKQKLPNDESLNLGKSFDSSVASKKLQKKKKLKHPERKNERIFERR